MTTLAANQPRDYQLGDNERVPGDRRRHHLPRALPSARTARAIPGPLVAGDPFQGFAIAKVWTTPVALPGRRLCRCGPVAASSCRSRASPSRRTTVRSSTASDDDTFTLTASTNTPIGFVSRWISTGLAARRVRRCADARLRGGDHAAAVTGGGPAPPLRLPPPGSTSGASAGRAGVRTGGATPSATLHSSLEKDADHAPAAVRKDHHSAACVGSSSLASIPAPPSGSTTW